MSDTEVLYGYLIAGLLAVSAILVATITHGKGAPTTHRNPIVPWVGFGLAFVVAASVRYRVRLLAGFAAVVCAFFINFNPVPSSLSGVKIFALVGPLAFAFWMMTKHRKYQRAKLAARPQLGAAERRAQSEAKRNAKRAKRSGATAAAANAKLPPANRRYTPPKPRRPKPLPEPTARAPKAKPDR